MEKSLAAVALLDPNNPRSLPELVKVLRASHWRVRGAAMQSLAQVEAGPLRSELRLTMITHDEAWVREGVASAMELGPRKGDAEALVAAMDDEDWRVRRTVARALGEIVSREGAERLVKVLEDEQDLRVRVWAKKSLRGIVGSDLGADPRRWREWYERHKDRPEWTRQGEEVLREEFAGVPLETVTIGSASGDGQAERPDLFVLAPFGFTHEWFRPYLDEAARFVRITYVTLPTVQEITKHSGYGASTPVYPVDKLAKALDRLRERREKESIVILASGPVGWIAEKYAIRYPKHVTALALVNTWLDSESYAGGLMRLASKGRSSERWAANNLMNRIEAARDAEEGRRLRRVFLTHALTDRRDTEAYRLYRTAARDHGFVTVPDLKFTRQVKVHVPTLFYFADPDLSPMSGATEGDLRRIRASFRKPNPVIAVMRDSRGLSHVEDPEEFLRILEGFLRHAGAIR